MFLRAEKMKNGDGYTPIYFYSCDDCGKEICESEPHKELNDSHICLSCCFIKGSIKEKKFLEYSGIVHDGFKAGVHEGEIHIWQGKTAPWEMSNSDYRRTKEYRIWRESVLKRDQFKCQHCGSEQDLQAHHIKPFATYKKLRFKTSNGLTLCESCHRGEHKRLRSG